ncbi:MAG: serine hydrolase domain-containing protein [Pseudomonadota bacterium]|nr:serine hydrolase domain-containing protein [Pseudomonadota bacterium]
MWTGAGSISKVFTALAAMQLAERGRLDIDSDVGIYLPDLPATARFPNAGPITPRRLITHHSGLASDRLKGMWTLDPQPFSSLVPQISENDRVAPPRSGIQLLKRREHAAGSGRGERQWRALRSVR